MQGIRKGINCSRNGNKKPSWHINSLINKEKKRSKTRRAKHPLLLSNYNYKHLGMIIKWA
jgi:hypothetical protein